MALMCAIASAQDPDRDEVLKLFPEEAGKVAVVVTSDLPGEWLIEATHDLSECPFVLREDGKVAIIWGDPGTRIRVLQFREAPARPRIVRKIFVLAGAKPDPGPDPDDPDPPDPQPDQLTTRQKEVLRQAEAVSLSTIHAQASSGAFGNCANLVESGEIKSPEAIQTYLTGANRWPSSARPLNNWIIIEMNKQDEDMQKLRSLLSDISIGLGSVQ